MVGSVTETLQTSFTASLSHFGTMLPKSSSCPSLPKGPITQLSPYFTRKPGTLLLASFQPRFICHYDLNLSNGPENTSPPLLKRPQKVFCEKAFVSTLKDVSRIRFRGRKDPPATSLHKKRPSVRPTTQVSSPRNAVKSRQRRRRRRHIASLPSHSWA